MGRDLQKRKRRSSRPTIRQSNKPKRTLNPRGNSIIAKNWDKRQTLSQNYSRLGLVSKIGKSTGGVEPVQSPAFSDEEDSDIEGEGRRKASRIEDDPLAINTKKRGATLAQNAIKTVRVERGADGKISRVLRKENPLNDPLNDLESDASIVDEDIEPVEPAQAKRCRKTVADELEKQADVPIVPYARHQSEREREWIESLVAKHGEDNVAAMARDLKLNPMQQTKADIAKRISIWKAGR